MGRYLLQIIPISLVFMMNDLVFTQMQLKQVTPLLISKNYLDELDSFDSIIRNNSSHTIDIDITGNFSRAQSDLFMFKGFQP